MHKNIKEIDLTRCSEIQLKKISQYMTKINFEINKNELNLIRLISEIIDDSDKVKEILDIYNELKENNIELGKLMNSQNFYESIGGIENAM